MAKIYVVKDDLSFYITAFFNQDDQINFDWALSKSYTVVVADGTVNILKDPAPSIPIDGIGLYRVPPGEKLTVKGGTDKSIIICPFLLGDDILMNELFPLASTLSSLRNHVSSYLIPTTDLTVCEDSGILEYGTTSQEPIVYTLTDLNDEVLGKI